MLASLIGVAMNHVGKPRVLLEDGLPVLDDMGLAVGLGDFGLRAFSAALNVGGIFGAEVGWVGNVTLLLAFGGRDASSLGVVDVAGATGGGGEANHEREEGE